MNMSKLELFHRYGIPSYSRRDSSATPLEKPQNFNVIPHITQLSPNYMAYGYMTFLFLCDVSSLHNTVSCLPTFIICLISTIYLACHKMNYTPHHICLHFMYVLIVSCTSVLSLQTLIIQVQLCLVC
jgi:hypothetical protein